MQQLSVEGYKTQSTEAPLGIIQAQKAGFLRELIAADKAFTIPISGEPNDFTINIGIGKWIQNLVVAAFKTLFISWLFLVIDIPEMIWTRQIEGTIIKEVTQIVGRAFNSGASGRSPRGFLEVTATFYRVLENYPLS